MRLSFENQDHGWPWTGSGMLPLSKITAVAAFNWKAHRFVVVALIALPSLCGTTTVTRAEAPSPTSPPLVTESAATMPTTAVTRAPSPSDELNTLLMHDTFLIVGPTKVQGQISFGKVFVMGIPFKDNPSVAHIVVVTAAHVSEGISGDNATLQLRRKNADGNYTAIGYQFPIRKDGTPLHVRHATADVAAMYADIPDEVATLRFIVVNLLCDAASDIRWKGSWRRFFRWRRR
jgi:hypothetical protein